MTIVKTAVKKNTQIQRLKILGAFLGTTSAFLIHPITIAQNINENTHILTGVTGNDPVLNQLDQGKADADTIEQVTSVSQLNDVQPSDWAFQALQSLVERYGCIAGYPNSTFRGNRALSRYEFAAGLNACLGRINEVIDTSTNDLAKKDDVSKLERLQEEFKAELGTLRGRVDVLEARTAELQANQFSTTTRLFGQAIFGLQGRSNNSADLFPRDGRKETVDPGTNINFTSNVQLSLITQFNNRSILLTGLQAGNGSTSPRLTNNVRLAYEGNTGNDLYVSDLTYRFLLDDKFAMIIGAEGVSPVSVFRGPNRVESAGQGPISAFAQRNPILNIGGGRGGIGFDWQFARKASLQAVYAANNPSSPSGQSGLFDGNTVSGAQLALTPVNPVDITLYYLNAYSPDGFLLTGVGDDQLVPFNTATGTGIPLNTNAIGGTLNWRINSRIAIGGWGGYTNSGIPGQSGNVETINWMTYINLPDLFRRGNLGGIYVGQPPKIFNSDLSVGNNIPDLVNGGRGISGGQPATTTHVEGFYRWRLSDNISITPGVVLIFQPRNTSDSDTISIGTLRTTFTF
jgi:hypothetical protein